MTAPADTLGPVTAPQPGAPGPAGVPGQPPLLPTAPGAPGAPIAPGGAPGSPAAPAQRAGRSRARGVGLTFAAALLIFVTVVFVLFVIFNTQTVQISLVFGDVRAPLVLALVIAAALGGLLVALFSLVRRARRSSKS
jgi:uncharacterized integral membrane protein